MTKCSSYTNEDGCDLKAPKNLETLCKQKCTNALKLFKYEKNIYT